MPRPSLLLSLRLLAIVLFLLVLQDIGTLVEIFSYDGFNNIQAVIKRSKLFQPEKPILWEDIDLQNPAFLNHTAAESLRVNEFLARSIYACGKRSEIGGDYDGFVFCSDGTEKQNPLLITGALFEEGDFEKTLQTERWTVFLPQTSSIIDDLKGDVVVNYLPSLSDYSQWDLTEITQHLENEKFSLAKIDLFSPLLPESQLAKVPKLIDRLIPHIRARQLLLTVRIEENDAAETLFGWYSTFYRLFFKSNYALVGAQTSGSCGVPVKHCRYRVTFAKSDVFGVKEAPTFGLGSPIEERKRLQHYLSRIDANCSSKSESTPQICRDRINLDDCHIGLFSYRKVDPRSFKELACQITLVQPESSSESRELPSNVRVVEKGISTNEKNRSVPSPTAKSKWHLAPLAELLKVAHREIIVFDLDGAEWDVLAQMTANDCSLLEGVQQIAIRARLWIGEENENFRRFYLYFLRIEFCGFHKVIAGKHDDTTFSVAFQRIRV